MKSKFSGTIGFNRPVDELGILNWACAKTNQNDLS